MSLQEYQIIAALHATDTPTESRRLRDALRHALSGMAEKRLDVLPAGREEVKIDVKRSEEPRIKRARVELDQDNMKRAYYMYMEISRTKDTNEQKIDSAKCLSRTS